MDPDHSREELLPPPSDALRRIVDAAQQQGTLTEPQARELTEQFGDPPGARDSGLDEDAGQRFIRTTLQLIELCLREPSQPHTPLVNPLLQEQINNLCMLQGGKSWSLARQISDADRRGSDRRFTFGQVKEVPADPEAPSFFGGAWLVDCDGSPRRVSFVMHADALPETVQWEEVSDSSDEYAPIFTRVHARGSFPWRLQVEVDSDLGRWITALAGTHTIGQVRGQIPLGVLSEAVRRVIEPRGLTHLLLGPSRRDPPSRPWHTGAFLRRIGQTPDFQWQGHGIETRTQRLITARCTVRVSARILGLLGG